MQLIFKKWMQNKIISGKNIGTIQNSPHTIV